MPYQIWILAGVLGVGCLGLIVAGCPRAGFDAPMNGGFSAGPRVESMALLPPKLVIRGEGWEPSGPKGPQGCFVTSATGGRAAVTGEVPLPRPLPPGEYFVFLRCISQGEVDEIQLSCGGGTSRKVRPLNKDWNGEWTEAIPLAVRETADHMTLTVLVDRARAATMPVGFALIRGPDRLKAGQLELHGLYLTTDPNEFVDKFGTVAVVHADGQGDHSLSARGNYVANGSFEAGYGHGWGAGQGGRDYTLRDLWDTKEAHHGKASMRLPAGGSLTSRVIPIRPGKPYTLSVWAKPAQLPASLDVSVFNDSKTFAERFPQGLSGRKPSARLSKATQLRAGWQQVTLSGELTDYPSPDVHVRLSSARADVWIDEVQLAEGDRTDFVPHEPLEVGLLCDKVSNIFLEDEKIAATLLAHNGASEAYSGSIHYEIYDHLNRKAKAGSVPATVKPGQTWRRELDMGTGGRGAFRVVLWADGQTGAEEEVAYSVVPRPRVEGPDPSSMIGVHASPSDSVLAAMSRLGVKWHRSLSPTWWMRWEVVEREKGRYVWPDSEVRKTASHGFEILGCIQGWAPWAQKDGKKDLDEWEKYVFAVVTHYKDVVKHWEVRNEPLFEFTPVEYADVLHRAARSIRKADPKAKIVGMGGSWSCAWCLEVLKALGDDPWRCLDLVSCHLYPPSTEPIDPEHVPHFYQFRDQIIAAHGKEVWNTETGTWCMGLYKGANSNFRYVGQPLVPDHPDSRRYYLGANNEAERTARNFLDSIGNGQSRYFYYDARLPMGPDYYKTHCTLLENDDTLRPKGVAYAVLAWLFDHSVGLGPIALDPNVYAYVFDRGGTGIVGLWAADHRNRALTLGLDPSQFRVYDLMGNEIKTRGAAVPFGRTPIYIEARAGLTVERLKMAFANAKLAPSPDTTPPCLSISEAPRGQTDGRAVRIRYFAADDTSGPGFAGAGGVLYSFRLVGRDKDWSAWNERELTFYRNLPPGEYRFEVKAKDEAGNVSETVSRGFSVASEPPAKDNQVPASPDGNIP